MKRWRHKWARLLSNSKDIRKGSFQANQSRQCASQSIRKAKKARVVRGIKMKMEWRRFLKIKCHSILR